MRAPVEPWGLEFARELKRIRTARSLSQRALAGAAGLTQSCISYIERGAVTPREDTVDRLGLALGVNFDDVTPWGRLYYVR